MASTDLLADPPAAGSAVVPLCDLERQTALLEPELLAAVQRVLRSARFILGPEERAFSTELAQYVGTSHAVGVASGTDALMLALTAAGLRPGGRVLTTPFSFFATAEAIIRAGGEPVFSDIDPATYNLEPTGVRAVLDGASPLHRRLGISPESIQAVLPVHLFGHPADTPALRALADARGLILVEDAAQALGSHQKGRRAGTVGHAGCFSFFPSKNLGGFGDGGVVVTDDTDLAGSVAALRVHGATAPHLHARVGVNSRLDELQAALLRVKLPKLDGWLERRRAHAASYGEMLAGVGIPEDRCNGGHSFQQYTVRAPGGRRDDLRRHLAAEGIESAVYYPRPLHLQPALRHLGYRRGDLPLAEEAAASVLSLPMFPELTTREVERVAAAVRRFTT